MLLELTMLLVVLAVAGCQILNGADDFEVEQPSTSSGFSFPTSSGGGGGGGSGGSGGTGQGGLGQGGAGGDNG